MNELLYGFEFSRAYTEYFLILTKGDWRDHVKNMELTLNKLKEKGLKCNIEKSFFGKKRNRILRFLDNTQWRQTHK